jgi:hypothetical protein
MKPGTTTNVQTAPTDLVYPKNPPLSPHICWINLIVAGLAQLIHGQVVKGIALFAACWTLGWIIPVVGNLSIVVVSLIDGYMVGKALKMGKTLTKWQWFPS